MLSSRFALAVAVSLLALTTPTDVNATPAHSRAGLQLVGYRILVEPQVVEAKNPRMGLITQSITWKLRSVYADTDGNELLVRPYIRRKLVNDQVVKLNRPWMPGDVSRQSADYVDLRQAHKRFRGFKKATRLDLLDVQIGLVLQPEIHGPGVAISATVGGSTLSIQQNGLPHAVIIEQRIGDDPPPPAHVDPLPSCRDALLAAGHHPQHLDNCRGVEPYCAVALLQAGHHPQHLDDCEPHLSAACTTHLLAQGHHPQLLDNCEGVEETCAVTLLEQGRHPQHLDNCKP